MAWEHRFRLQQSPRSKMEAVSLSFYGFTEKKRSYKSGQVQNTLVGTREVSTTRRRKLFYRSKMTADDILSFGVMEAIVLLSQF